MTQIKEGLIKSQPYTYACMTTNDSIHDGNKSPSADLISLLSAAASGMLAFGELWDTVKKKGGEEGFDEKELLTLFAPMVKDKFTAAQVRYLMNKEKEQERARDNRIKQKEELKSLRTYAHIPPKKELEHLELPDPVELPLKQSIVDQMDDEEDPKDLEIQFLKEKVTELEDALRKTEQFKPANQLTEEQAKGMVMQAVQTGLAVPQLKLNEDTIFKWIADKVDGTHSFYYDTYGIELFQNRILSQLKNSGVKVFKRLYFEV